MEYRGMDTGMTAAGEWEPALKAASAAGAALNNIRSLAESAPPGRVFDAIATLSDLSHRTEDALVASGMASRQGDRDHSCFELARAVVLMDRLTSEAIPGEHGEPHYLRRRASG